eukprot:2456026-Prymnesium_polylepis.2
MEGPCIPRMYEIRPTRHGALAPVTAYALVMPRLARTLQWSVGHRPAKTPVELFIKLPRVDPAACSATYPSSSAIRWCGSITSASAGERPKEAWSKRSMLRTNAP